MTTLLVFVSIVLLFGVFLAIKKSSTISICAICLAVSVTWVWLFITQKAMLIDEPALLAILMGESALGVYYLVDERVAKHFTIFRLPFLLTLTLMVYTAVTLTVQIPTYIFVGSVWIVFLFIYMYRYNDHVNQIIKSLADCCGKW